MQKTFKLPEFGLEVEIGKFARQADGSAWIKNGNNIVLSTAVACKEPKEFMGFFPLTVEYRERFFAAGKIPGGYIKREGRLTDTEVLTSRLIDRPLRPLFPSYYFNEVQLISNVYSYDGKFPTNILALIGSSLALTISPIPFLGPIGAVQIGKVNEKWKFNPEYEESLKSDTVIVIAGTRDGICMVEGYCNNIPEKEFIDLMFQAHEKIKIQIDWQLEIQKALNIKKAEIKTAFDWDSWKKKVKDFFSENFAETLFTKTKDERKAVMDKLRSDLIGNFSDQIESGQVSKSILFFLFDSLLKEILPDLVIKKGIRIDGRKLDKVRPLEIEVANLPCSHGSATFRRGETFALSGITLGTAKDAQKVETLIGEPQEKRFMLHYNFPPFSVGEVRMIRGLSRRDIGHGYLAENSFYNVLPDKEKFPYTIRSVVDILESNGSSSMATVCATTMALLDGGIPIKDMVSGIAMGLLQDSSGKIEVLTDILGIEDALGLMDFKVVGTDKGIMAIQMDIKAKTGLTKDQLEKALDQAKTARLHILTEMKTVLDLPRKKLSDLAPRVHLFKITPDKIGNIIGPAGRTIKEIIAQTNTQIDIKDDGTVVVYAKDVISSNKAVKWINVLAGDIEIGMTFEGPIRRITDFGMFVELVPGKDGLIHISNIARSKQRDLYKLYKPGDKLKVKVVNYDKETDRVNLVSSELKEHKN